MSNTKIEHITDEELELLFEKYDGQPVKVANHLGVRYVTIRRRVLKSKALQEIQESTRHKVFQNVSSLTSAAVLMGLMKSPKTDEFGNVVYDDKGKPIYIDVVVEEKLRLEYGSRLMGLFKGDEGIKDQVEITKSEITGVILSDDDDE